jgi:hypothetical protein
MAAACSRNARPEGVEVGAAAGRVVGPEGGAATEGCAIGVEGSARGRSDSRRTRDGVGAGGDVGVVAGKGVGEVASGGLSKSGAVLIEVMSFRRFRQPILDAHPSRHLAEDAHPLNGLHRNRTRRHQQRQGELVHLLDDRVNLGHPT